MKLSQDKRICYSRHDYKSKPSANKDIHFLGDNTFSLNSRIPDKREEENTKKKNTLFAAGRPNETAARVMDVGN